MMKFVKKIILFFSLFLYYLVAKEFLQLYTQLKILHPYAAYSFLVLLAVAVVWLLIIPLIRLLNIKRFEGPARTAEAEKGVIERRIKQLQKNPFLQESDIDLNITTYDKETYKLLITPLEKQCMQLRNRHISQMFYSTAIAQNGFLDAVLILAISIQHVKEIFLLYNGRVSNRDLWKIARLVYYSALIGGSEGVEYSTKELLNKFTTDSLKAIPFLDKIMASLADGLVNAALLTRISYLTERYCKLTLISSEKDFYPSPAIIVNSVTHITSDILSRLSKTLKKMAAEKTKNAAQFAINPVGYLLAKAIDEKAELTEREKEIRKDQAKLIGNPLAYGMEKLISSLKRK